MATPCFFVAGDPEKFYKFAGEARTRVGEELNLVDRDRFELCWIVDFPFYEWNEEEKKIDFAHNPFSMPQGGIEALNGAGSADASRPSSTTWSATASRSPRARIRNHLPETMVKAFEMVGLDASDGRGALRRPLPRLPVRRAAAWRHGGRHRPHRHAAAAARKNLREITLFPMNQQAEDLLMGAPSRGDAEAAARTAPALR